MQFLTTVLLDGLVYASYLFIVSLGLTITFGVMKILNVAHGSFYAWGAYLASIAIIYLGENEYNSMFYYFSIFMAAIVAGLFFGFIIERFILRKMYGEDIHLIVLATFGIFWILEDLILIVFGADPLMPYYPAMELGGLEIAGVYQGVYSLTLSGLAVVVAFICWYFLKKTNGGNYFNLLSLIVK